MLGVGGCEMNLITPDDYGDNQFQQETKLESENNINSVRGSNSSPADILLIVPKFDLAKHGKDYTYFFPIALSYILAIVKKAGYKVDTINLNHEVGIIEPLNSKLNNDYKWVLIGGNALEYPILEQIMQIIRNHPTKPKVVLGGNVLTSEPELIFNALKPDIGCVGEADETILEILQGKPLNKINGIIYRQQKQKEVKTLSNLTSGDTKHGGVNAQDDTKLQIERSASLHVDNHSADIIMTPPREPVKDLDTIPFPDYEGLGFREYLDNIHPNDVFYYSVNDHPRFYVIMGSRSCPYQCTFCWHYNKYRERSAKNIVDEMEQAIKKFEINIFFLSDECASVTRGRLEELCNRMIDLKKRLKVNFNWGGMLRVDTVTPKILKLMKKSGCIFIGYGFESYSPIVLKSMNKGITPKAIKRALELTMKAKINVHAGFIFGDIAETKETAEETMSFYEDYCKGQVQLHMVKPYPNSKIYQYAIAKGIIPDKLQFIKDIVKDEKKYFNITETMSDDEVAELEEKLFKLLSKYRITIVPDVVKTEGKNLYDLSFYCPFCGKHMYYQNYVINNKLVWHYNVLCRNCCMRFCLASNTGKYMLEHMELTRYIRDLNNWRLKMMGLIKNKLR